MLIQRLGARLVFCLGKNGSYRELAEFLPVKWVWHINRLLNVKKPWDTVSWILLCLLAGAIGLKRLSVCLFLILDDTKLWLQYFLFLPISMKSALHLKEESLISFEYDYRGSTFCHVSESVGVSLERGQCVWRWLTVVGKNWLVLNFFRHMEQV